MTEKVTRKTRKPGFLIAHGPDEQLTSVGQTSQDPDAMVASPIQAAALEQPNELLSETSTLEDTSPQPKILTDDEPPAPASSNKAPSKKIKIIHRHWERVCHAVPKCDACGKKGGQAGVLQRCLSCTTQLCRECVENGALEPGKDSVHPAVHIMHPLEVDWSPVTREEKTAQTKQKKLKKAPEARTTSIKAKGKGKSTAIKGAGLRKKDAKNITEKFTTESSAANAILPPAANKVGTSPVNLVATSTFGPRSRKRELSPDEDSMEFQAPEKYPRMTVPPATMTNHLAPLRPVMEPHPTPRLPSMSHIGYHSLHYGRYASHAVHQQARQAFNQSGCHPSAYDHPGYGSQTPDDRHMMDYRHRGGELHSVPGTPVASKLGSSPGVHSSAQSVGTDDHVMAQNRIPCSGTLSGYPPASRPQQDLATHSQHPLPTQPRQTLPPPYVSVQELSSELYHDVLKTRSDYGWDLSICLVHEISRSWSRGALHQLAAELGPADVGLDVLYSVANCVAEWLGMRNDRGLYDWLTGEREWLQRR